MRKKLLAALIFQIILAVAVLLSPYGITKLIEKFGTEDVFTVTEARLYDYSFDEDERNYQLDMSVVPDGKIEIRHEISGTDANGNYFGYNLSSGSGSGFCIYRFKDKTALKKFASAFDNSVYYSDALNSFVKSNDITVEIKHFYKYITVEGVYVNGEELEKYTLEKGF